MTEIHEKLEDTLEEVFQSTRTLENVFCDYAKKGDIKSISKHIAEGYPVNCKDDVGWTAMHYACQGGFYECVKLLIANGGLINVFDWNLVYPLHLAAKGNHLNIVKFLLMSDAKWDVETRNNCRPIDFCPYDSELWKVLKNASEGKMPVLDHLEQTRDVPLIPVHAFSQKPLSATSKGGKGKKGKKSGKKGKKSGKKKGKKKK